MLRGKHWDDGWLTVFWGKEERRDQNKDLVFGSPCRPDAHLLVDFFYHTKTNGGDKTLLEELKERGYDISTLQFSVKRKYKPNEKPPE